MKVWKQLHYNLLMRDQRNEREAAHFVPMFYFNLSFNVWCPQNGSSTSWSLTYNSRGRFTKCKAMDKIVFSEG